MPATLPDSARVVKYDNCCVRQRGVIDGGHEEATQTEACTALLRVHPASRRGVVCEPWEARLVFCLDEWIALVIAMHPAAYCLARALGTLGARGLA